MNVPKKVHKKSAAPMGDDTVEYTPRIVTTLFSNNHRERLSLRYGILLPLAVSSSKGYNTPKIIFENNVVLLV